MTAQEERALRFAERTIRRYERAHRPRPHAGLLRTIVALVRRVLAYANATDEEGRELGMDRSERAQAYLHVVGLLSEARTKLDALSVGDPSDVPNTLKHLLDEPIERVRAYGRSLSLADSTPAPAPAPSNEHIYTCLRASCGWSGPFWRARVNMDNRTVICPECGAICIGRTAEEGEEGAGDV